MYEQNDVHFCHSCGVKFLANMAIKACKTRRQACSSHDRLVERQEKTEKRVEKARRIIAESKGKLAAAKNLAKEQERERVNAEKEYKRLSKTLGGVVVVNRIERYSSAKK